MELGNDKIKQCERPIVVEFLVGVVLHASADFWTTDMQCRTKRTSLFVWNRWVADAKIKSMLAYLKRGQNKN